MKKLIAVVLASVMTTTGAHAAGFTDIGGHWAESAVNTLAGLGVVNGVTDTLFMPDGTVTRAQYLKMVI